MRSPDVAHHAAFLRYQPWRRRCEVGFWLVSAAINISGNAVVAVMDARRSGSGLPDWMPASWEITSGLVLLALVPALVWFTRRNRLHWRELPRLWPRYLLASIAFSLAHVFGMVALRMLAYRIAGDHYEFGAWPRGLFYEYLKDVRTFVSMVLTIEAYRFVMLRWQGEARLLDAPDEGAPVEPLDRPGRFLVRKLGREFLVAAADIEWLQAAGNYVNLHVRGRDYPLRSTMAAIEQRLDPQRFVRIHRSYIVNVGQVASIEPLEGGEARIHLRDGGTLPCSRRHREALRGSAES